MIIGVALKRNLDWMVFSLPKPNRHNHVIKYLIDNNITTRVIGSEWTQGFITNDYIFLDREQAAEHALIHKQIKEPVPLLFSEDLW